MKEEKGEKEEKRYRGRNNRRKEFEIMASNTTKVGRGGRTREDTKQRKLPIEDKCDGKKVTFERTVDKGVDKVDKKETTSEVDKVRESICKEIRKLKEEWEKKLDNVKGRIIAIEKFIIEQREENKKWIEEMKKLENDRGREEDLENIECASGYSAKSNYTAVSRRTMSNGSWDRYSNCLSEAEINKVRKYIKDKEREERKDNIVIKGIKIDENMSKLKIEEFIKEKLGVEIKIKGWRAIGY